MIERVAQKRNTSLPQPSRQFQGACLSVLRSYGPRSATAQPPPQSMMPAQSPKQPPTPSSPPSKPTPPRMPPPGCELNKSPRLKIIEAAKKVTNTVRDPDEEWVEASEHLALITSVLILEEVLKRTAKDRIAHTKRSKVFRSDCPAGRVYHIVLVPSSPFPPFLVPLPASPAPISITS